MGSTSVFSVDIVRVRPSIGAMRRYAFSLVELLVVIAVIAVLSGLLLPVTNMLFSSAKSARCANGARQIGLSFFVYGDDFSGLYPPPSDGSMRWNMRLYEHVTGLSYLQNFETSTKRSIFACPEIRQVILADQGVMGYGMVLRLPPSDSAASYAIAAATAPVPARFVSAPTTPLVACSVGCLYGQSLTPKRIEGSYHLGAFLASEQRDLVGYALRGRGNLLLADGHVVTASLSQMPAHVQSYAVPDSLARTY